MIDTNTFANLEGRETAELRREAAELLARSPWWQRERLREELLSRRWYRPQPAA